ncbi:hypothetical protein KDW_31290 [Dictyobacter vulcani]|uniref:Zinc finger Ogr/Delta-type domain-containing protein n=1 Tax=Dictyobacter vulcani TaxID=2607529 RepID=A0A5J4KRI1_9CHLR|nr:hypothetical protein KDW_31290 [Dictyobacter vulcani]
MTIENIMCPHCKGVMELRKQDTSYTSGKTKYYHRQFLVCRADDIWMRLETPKESSEQNFPTK